MSSGSATESKTDSRGSRWQRLEHDERRAQILAAAGRLYSDKPYSSVSTTDIADAAGVTRGLLHHYFGTKRELYLEVIRSLVSIDIPIRRGAANAWEASDDAWLALIETNRDSWLVAIGAGETGRDAELHEILDEARELTASRVLEALGIDPATAGPEVRALVRTYGGMSEEATREWLDRGRLTKAQVRLLLVRSLPLLLDQLLDAVVAAGSPEP